jgi:hypothetical protein
MEEMQFVLSSNQQLLIPLDQLLGQKGRQARQLVEAAGHARPAN